jgi:A/G-specific adenine glycosylase
VQPPAEYEGKIASSRFTFHVSRLLIWFTANARDLPWRRTHDPYAVWVSEIMLQQTQVKTVLPYFERWMRELPNVHALANASLEKIHKLWEGLGYYTRVRNMQKAARMIVDTHVGEFPRNFNDVLALPGIGRYTAGAICSIAFNQPTPILDGNVIRVLTRVFGLRENVREKETNLHLWKLAEKLVQSSQQHPSLTVHGVPIGSCSALNQSLMELGALVCTPRQPRCEECPLQQRCFARREGQVELLPNLGERPGSTARRFGACVIERDGAFWIRQRPAGVVNAHLWEFPNAELPLKISQAAAHKQLEAELGCALEAFTKFATVKHTITRYRITLEAFHAKLNGSAPRKERGEWVSLAHADRLPFTSAHRRLLKMLAQDRNAGGTPSAR